MMKNPVIFNRGLEDLAIGTLAITFYFDCLSRSLDLIEILQDAVVLASDQFTWHRQTGEQRNAPMPENYSVLIDNARSAREAGRGFELILDSGRTLDSTGSWAIKYCDAPEYEGDVLGFLQMHCPHPQDAVESHKIELQMLKWCERASLRQAYAGFSVNHDFGDVDRERDAHIRSHCERFIGVDCSDLITQRRALLAHIKNAQWLTYLGSDLLAANPGRRDSLRRMEGVHRAGNGLLIRSGDMPEMADANRREFPRDLIRVNGLLSPWLIDSMFPLPGFPDEESTRTWLHRTRPTP